MLEGSERVVEADADAFACGKGLLELEGLLGNVGLEGSEEVVAIEGEGLEELEAGVADDEQGRGLEEGGGARAEEELERMDTIGGVGEVSVDFVEDEEGDGRVGEGRGVGGVKDGGDGNAGSEGVDGGLIEGGDALGGIVFEDGEVFCGEAGDGLAFAVDDGGIEQNKTGGDGEGGGLLSGEQGECDDANGGEHLDAGTMGEAEEEAKKEERRQGRDKETNE